MVARPMEAKGNLELEHQEQAEVLQVVVEPNVEDEVLLQGLGVRKGDQKGVRDYQVEDMSMVVGKTILQKTEKERGKWLRTKNLKGK